MLMLTQQQQALQLGIPVVTPENYYNTLVELTKAGDFASPNRFWTDPKSIPPKPEKPPPELIKAQMDNQSAEKIKAAELIQREIESQRKSVLEKYNIDSQTGLEIVHKQVSHGHTVAIEGMKASHQAILDGLGAKLEGLSAKVEGAHTKASKAVDKAHESINNNSLSLEHVSNVLNDSLTEMKKTTALATGHRRIRKGKDGTIDGVDILHPDTGEVIASHKAIKDKSGRVVGMQ